MRFEHALDTENCKLIVAITSKLMVSKKTFCTIIFKTLKYMGFPKKNIEISSDAKLDLFRSS